MIIIPNDEIDVHIDMGNLNQAIALLLGCLLISISALCLKTCPLTPNAARHRHHCMNNVMNTGTSARQCATTDSSAEDIDRIILESELILSRTNGNEVFTTEELDSLCDSFRHLANLSKVELDYQQLTDFAQRVIHLSFKQSFSRTEEAAKDLGQIIGRPGTDAFRSMFHRVLADGGWDNALEYASTRFQSSSGKDIINAMPQSSSSSIDTTRKHKKPWVVLVTGLNGIRKTTSIHAPWFRTVLYEALSAQLIHTDVTIDDLPVGNNSFFRQLDFLVATVANAEFKRLYSLRDVKSYAMLKNAIFARYRNLAEICGR